MPLALCRRHAFGNAFSRIQHRPTASQRDRRGALRSAHADILRCVRLRVGDLLPDARQKFLNRTAKACQHGLGPVGKVRDTLPNQVRRFG